MPSGRLKLRHLEDGDAAQLIFYARDDKDGPKLSDYHIATSDVPNDLSTVLGKALGIRGEVTFIYAMRKNAAIDGLY